MKNPQNYSEHWRERIRPSVLKRDNYKCVICGALNHSKGYYDKNDHFIICDTHMQQWAIKNGIKLRTVHLQVAHLDQDPSNNEMSNLKTFCPRHHFKHDHEFNRLKRKASGHQQ